MMENSALFFICIHHACTVVSPSVSQSPLRLKCNVSRITQCLKMWHRRLHGWKDELKRIWWLKFKGHSLSQKTLSRTAGNWVNCMNIIWRKHHGHLWLTWNCFVIPILSVFLPPTNIDLVNLLTFLGTCLTILYIHLKTSPHSNGWQWTPHESSWNAEGHKVPVLFYL